MIYYEGEFAVYYWSSFFDGVAQYLVISCLLLFVFCCHFCPGFIGNEGHASIFVVVIIGPQKTCTFQFY